MSVFIDDEKCIGCDICVPICPSQAISIIQNKAVINHDKCNECLQCMDECPANAIYQILDKEVSVVKRENLIPESVTQTAPQPKQLFWDDQRKQQVIEIGEMVLSGIKKLANNFLRADSSPGRGKQGSARRVKHRRRHGRR